MMRRLRVSLSCMCFAVFLATSVSWVYSMRAMAVLGGFQDGGLAAAMRTVRGRIIGDIRVGAGAFSSGELSWTVLTETDVGRIDSFLAQHRRSSLARPRILGFGISASPGWCSFVIPHWLLAIVSGLGAVFLRPKPRKQFGLRDVFAMTTVIAILAYGFASL
ncbi:MAG: hypothetical protein AAF961_05575, partial [Planctomycetota bacterium]